MQIASKDNLKLLSAGGPNKFCSTKLTKGINCLSIYFSSNSTCRLFCFSPASFPSAPSPGFRPRSRPAVELWRSLPSPWQLQQQQQQAQLHRLLWRRSIEELLSRCFSALWLRKIRRRKITRHDQIRRPKSTKERNTAGYWKKKCILVTSDFAKLSGSDFVKKKVSSRN